MNVDMIAVLQYLRVVMWGRGGELEKQWLEQVWLNFLARLELFKYTVGFWEGSMDFLSMKDSYLGLCC